MKPFRENATAPGGRIEPLSESSYIAQSPLGSQVTCWDENKREQQRGSQRLQAQPGQHLPGDRAHFPGRTFQSGPRFQNVRGPQPNRTKGLSYSHSNSTLPTQQGSAGGPVTMVTATASVTVAVHPTLPGAAYQGYMHEGFDTDSESDCFEAAKRTYGDKTNFSSCKRDSLELQDLEATQGQTEYQLDKTQGEQSFQASLSLTVTCDRDLMSPVPKVWSLSVFCLLQVSWGSRHPKTARPSHTPRPLSSNLWATPQNVHMASRHTLTAVHRL